MSDHLLWSIFQSSLLYHITNLDLLCWQLFMYCTLDTSSLEIWVVLMMQFPKGVVPQVLETGCKPVLLPVKHYLWLRSTLRVECQTPFRAKARIQVISLCNHLYACVLALNHCLVTITAVRLFTFYFLSLARSNGCKD